MGPRTSTPWDKMPTLWIDGVATVITVAGKHLKPKGMIRFTPTELVCNESGIPIPRAEVKEIVIRDRRSLSSYDDFFVGTLLGMNQGAVYLLALPWTIVSPPSWLVYQGAGHIVPTKTRFRVMP
jgi:hypothetical protein